MHKAVATSERSEPQRKLHISVADGCNTWPLRDLRTTAAVVDTHEL